MVDLTNIRLVYLFAEVIIFVALVVIGSYLSKKITKSNHKLLNPQEYLPVEEIHSLRQAFFLIMMGLIFADILYTLVFVGSDVYYLSAFDIALSLYLAVTLDKNLHKNKAILILLIPFGSLTFIVFGNTLIGLVDFLHIPVLIYFIKLYYDKFREYTQSNGLGITIILLFAIIFISFLVTQVAESVNPLDSLVMVSNAFTSNGYAVLGHTIPGKINSLILVWGGYLLSGVGTSTLTAAILITHFNSKMDDMNEKLDKLEELIKKNND